MKRFVLNALLILYRSLKDSFVSDDERDWMCETTPSVTVGLFGDFPRVTSTRNIRGAAVCARGELFQLTLSSVYPIPLL